MPSSASTRKHSNSDRGLHENIMRILFLAMMQNNSTIAQRPHQDMGEIKGTCGVLFPNLSPEKKDTK